VWTLIVAIRRGKRRGTGMHLRLGNPGLRPAVPATVFRVCPAGPEDGNR
jgi:hypothetical protein